MITYTSRRETIAKKKNKKKPVQGVLPNVKQYSWYAAVLYQHVCADNSALKHKETSCRVSCGDVGLTQSHMLFASGHYVDSLRHRRLEK